MSILRFIKAVMLIVILKTGNGSVRAKAAQSLGKLKSRIAVWSLIVTLRDKDRRVRSHSADALADIRDRSALQELEAVYHNKDEDIVVMVRVLHALRCLDPEKYGEPYTTQRFQ